MGELMQELHSIYGPVVLMWGFHRPFLFVSDRELAEKCLITLIQGFMGILAIHSVTDLWAAVW